MKLKKLTLLFELGRVSNLPTILSNVTTGFILGGGEISRQPGAWLATTFVVACMYEGGMILNDVCDHCVDKNERPDRPIPSGRVSLRGAILITVLFFIAGLVIAGFFIQQSLVIVSILLGSILAYNFTHRFFFLSPLLMGICRGCVYLLAATAAGWKVSFDWVLAMAGVLTSYVTAVSFIASDEVNNRLTFTHQLAGGFLLIALMMAASLPGSFNTLFWIALVFAATWIVLTGVRVARKQLTVMMGVGRILSGMSLLDAVIMTKLSALTGMLFGGSCFIGARLWQRKIRST